MTDELIDILNEDLTVLKSCLKSEAHKHGYLHASVHVWFYTNAGEILIQKRSATKIAFPCLWDVSLAGHI
jgi:isopentenyldiphosphate isomerase